MSCGPPDSFSSDQVASRRELPPTVDGCARRLYGGKRAAQVAGPKLGRAGGRWYRGRLVMPRADRRLGLTRGGDASSRYDPRLARGRRPSHDAHRGTVWLDGGHGPFGVMDVVGLRCRARVLELLGAVDAHRCRAAGGDAESD